MIKKKVRIDPLSPKAIGMECGTIFEKKQNILIDLREKHHKRIEFLICIKMASHSMMTNLEPAGV